MPQTIRILGQADLAATTITDLYKVPPATQTVLSSAVFANRTGFDLQVRFAVAVAGAADDPKQYLAYDVNVPGNDKYVLAIGITLAATDVVRAYASDVGMSINVFGSENT